MPRRQKRTQQADWLLKAMEMAFAKGKGLWAHSMLDALEGLTAEQAAWKPKKKGAHSIWEIVHHAMYWKEYLVRCLEGKAPVPAASDEASWHVETVSEEAWARTLRKLKRTHNALMRHLKAKQLDLNKPFPGTKSKAGEMLFGVLAHDLYHTGQIVLLRQMQGIELPS